MSKYSKTTLQLSSSFTCPCGYTYSSDIGRGGENSIKKGLQRHMRFCETAKNAVKKGDAEFHQEAHIHTSNPQHIKKDTRDILLSRIDFSHK
jgi:hypothetical protein